MCHKSRVSCHMSHFIYLKKDLDKVVKLVGGGSVINEARLWKNKLLELHRVQFLKRVSSKFVKFSGKFGSLNVQIRNNFKNIIFIACKWSKICKYYVNSMVISCSTCQKEEKECTWVKYLIYAVLSRFQICCNLRFFSAKSVFQKLQSSQKKWFFPSLLSTR